MNWKRNIVCAGIVMLSAMWGLTAQAQGAKVPRSIDHISGGLYKFTNKFHASVFLVTDAGIIATDPINAAAATWLKAELDKRFGQPVKYVIYSHHHADHVSGGEAFAGAEFVGHENIVDDLKKDEVPTPHDDVCRHQDDHAGGPVGGTDVSRLGPLRQYDCDEISG